MMTPMTPDMIAENARMFRKRGMAEPDAVRQAMSPSTPPMVSAQPVARMGPPPVGPMMRQPPGTLAPLGASAGTGAIGAGAPPPAPGGEGMMTKPPGGVPVSPGAAAGAAGGAAQGALSGAPPPSAMGPMAQMLMRRQMGGPSRM